MFDVDGRGGGGLMYTGDFFEGGGDGGRGMDGSWNGK